MVFYLPPFNKWIRLDFTKALYVSTSITLLLPSHKQVFLTLLCICVFLKKITYICVFVSAGTSSPFCTVPRAAGSEAYGTHARRVTKADFDCHTVQIYIYVRNEAAAKSQLLHSKIVCKTYNCAPVKISEKAHGNHQAGTQQGTKI